MQRPASSAPPPRRRGLRPALVVLVAVALLLGGVAGALWWAVRSETGSAWLLAQVPGLRVTGPRGVLLGDFEAERIEFALPREGTLVLEAAGWRGLRIERAFGRAPWRIVLERLYATRVDVKPGAPSGEPPQAPTELGLPIELVVEALEVQRLQATPLGETALRDLRARIHLGAEGGARHRFDAVSLALDPWRIAGALQVATDGALPLQLRLDLARDAPLGQSQLSAAATLAGPLAEPVLHATLRAQPVAGAASAPPQALDLDATLRPFQPWPLGELRARVQGLDLAALLSGAPTTALSGEARASTQARDQPASLDVQLVNGASGRWNEGRLPVRELALTLRGRPDDTRRFELPALQAELGSAKQPAGRIEGTGRWTPQGWSLDLLLKALQPAQLDARAASMDLSGRLHLRGSAPGPGTPTPTTLEAQAELSGRLTGRGPARPVQLRLDGAWHADAQQQRLELRKLLASAAGASASLSGRAERAAQASAWQLKGELALVEFDPLPWWRGPEDSPWRAGPHRINAKGSFDLALPVAPAAAASAAPARNPASGLAGVRGQAKLTLTRSQLAGVPLTAELGLRSAAGGPANVRMQLDADGNRIGLNGRVATRAGATDDSWDLDMDAPALARLAPVWRLVRGNAAQLAGSLRSTARLQGRWPGVLASSGSASASALRVDAYSASRADLRWQFATALDAPVEANLQLSGFNAGQATAESVQLRLDGTGRGHTLALQASSKLRPPAWTDALQTQGAPPPNGAAGPGNAIVAAQGGFFAGPGAAVAGWRGSLQQLELRPAQAGALPWLRARDLGVELGWAETAPLRLAVQPGRAELMGAALRWSHIAWRAAGAGMPTQIEAKAELEPLAIAPLLARLQPEFGWGGDLEIAGQLDIRSAPGFAADIVIERRRGDLSVTDEVGTQALGLTDLRLGLNAVDGTWSFTQALAGSTLGVAAGAVVARTTPTATWPAPDTPIGGVLELRVARLGAWGNWVPASWRLGGQLDVTASIGGRFGAPEYTGAVRGRALSVRNYLEGVSLSDGEVAIALQGTRAHIDHFEARGGTGTVRLEGDAVLGADPQADLKLVAEGFQLLGRLDRRIVTSGQARLRLDRETLALDGQFGVDEGLVDFTRSDAPSLSDDVVVVRAPRSVATGRAPDRAAAAAQAPPGAASAPPPQVAHDTPFALPKPALDLRVGLGNKLRVRGRGLDTRLRGDLHITSPGGRLAVNGSVSAVDGIYHAYGQKLVIDRGELVFNGPAGNPRLDIEATRPNLDVRVGVAVTGSAASPRIRLFSEPDMSDMDKLSWLVLGRASDGLGSTDTALLQQAALALLAGEGPSASEQLFGALGIDQISLRQSEGEVRETIVSLGKQLSQRWYVGYERSLNETAGNFQLIYRVARRFTLRARSGLDNSLDAIWTWRWQ